MSDPASSTASEAGRTVLIIPHCWECGSGLQMLLSISGYDAEIARGSERALRRCREAHPDVVFVDLHLPGENGFDVCRRLRGALGPRVRLIGLTSYEWNGDDAEWTQAGFDGWLRKPVHVQQLLELLEAAQ